MNTTLVNDNVEHLPYFIVNGTLNGVDYNTSTDDLFTHDFNILSGGNQVLNAFFK
ncbi:hypothetical protein [Methanobrevibacter arboriphilus]|uniref:hypothetical protein n=1 Tax=Methanobrevibacter arboriphilus TaxID=39441 RepID=UPI000AF65083|nr:hypothetical protein [Methanobrevibacter arboriphilus]